MGGHYATFEEGQEEKDRSLLPSLLKLFSSFGFLKSLKQVIFCLHALEAEQTHSPQQQQLHIARNLTLVRAVVSSILLFFLRKKNGILFLFDHLSHTEAIIALIDPYSLRSCTLPACIDYLPLSLTAEEEDEDGSGNGESLHNYYTNYNGHSAAPFTPTAPHQAALFRYHMHTLVGLDMLMSLCDPSGPGHINDHESLAMTGDKGTQQSFTFIFISYTFSEHFL